MASKQAVVTDLVGAIVEKRPHDEPGGMQWPSTEVNAANEYLGIVRAVWVDKEGQLALTVSTPNGQMFQTYPGCVRYVRGSR